MKDYSHLKGTEFTFIDKEGHEAVCFVAQIDPEIGMTCKGNWTDELETVEPHDFICIDLSKNYGNGNSREIFDYTVISIQKGKYNSKERMNFFATTVSTGIVNDCAFE